MFDFIKKLFNKSNKNESVIDNVKTPEIHENIYGKLNSNITSDFEYTMNRDEFIAYLESKFGYVKSNQYALGQFELNFKDELELKSNADALINIEVRDSVSDLKSAVNYIMQKCPYDESDNHAAIILNESKDDTYLEFLSYNKDFEYSIKFHVYVFIRGNVEITIWVKDNYFNEVYNRVYPILKDFYEIVDV